MGLKDVYFGVEKIVKCMHTKGLQRVPGKCILCKNYARAPQNVCLKVSLKLLK